MESENKKILTGAALTGLGLTALKARKDFGKALQQAHKFVSGVKAVAHNPNRKSLSQGVAAAKMYADLGQEAINTKILGLKIPYAVLHARTALQEAPRSLNKSLTETLKDYYRAFTRTSAKDKFDKAKLYNENYNSALGQGDPRLKGLKKYVPKDAKGWQNLWQHANQEFPQYYLHKHYSNYKNMDKDSLYRYAVLKDLPKQVSADAAYILNTTPIDNISSALLKMKRAGLDEDLAKTRKHLTDLKDMYAGGSDANSDWGYAQKYLDGSLKPVENIRKGLKGLAVGSFATGGALTAGGIGDTINNKTEEDQQVKKSSAEEDVRDGLLVGSGLGALGYGVDEIKRPLRVGASWSELPRHGDGHKNPGKAIYTELENIVERNPALKNVELIKAIRDNTNNYDARAFDKKFDMYADSGMGPTSQWDWQHFSKDERGQFRNANPKIAPGGFVGYMTDVGAFGSPNDGFQRSISPFRSKLNKLVKDNYITWGDSNVFDQANKKNTESRIKAEQFYKNFKRTHIGEGMPTLTDDAVRILTELQNKSRQDIINDALNSTQVSNQHKKVLKNLGDKKLIFISGSGRGDYVATRVKDWQRELKRRGLQDKYVIGAALGGGATKSPMSRMLKDSDNLMLFDRLPQNLYIGLPGVADFHDASTGTSAAFEAASTPSVLGFRKNWGEFKDRESKLLGTIKRVFGISADKDWKSEHEMVNLDGWNKGNRAAMLNKGGTLGMGSLKGGNGVASALDILEDPKVYAQMKDEAIDRSRREFGMNRLAKKNLGDTLEKIMMQQRNRKIGKGVLASILGLGLGSVGTSNLSDSYNKPTMLGNANAGSNRFSDILKKVRGQ